MKNTNIIADGAWIAKMAAAIKEDQSVIAELAERINETGRKHRPIKEQVEELLDDANYTKEVLKYEMAWSCTKTAKDLGMKSAQELMKELKALGTCYSNKRGEWMLKERYSGQGLEKYRVNKLGGTEHTYICWTQKGRQWLHALVKRGILQITPKPEPRYKKGAVAHQINKIEKKRDSTLTPSALKPTRNKEFLLSLINQMQGYFECVVSLAMDCIKENDDIDRRLLREDIRSINDTTSIMMWKLECECYNMLVQ